MQLAVLTRFDSGRYIYKDVAQSTFGVTPFHAYGDPATTMARLVTVLALALQCTSIMGRSHNVTGLNTVPRVQTRDDQPTLDISMELGLDSSNWQYNIKLLRCECSDCHCDPIDKISKPTYIHQNECRTWHDDPPFRSFQHGWSRNIAYTRELEDYGTCEIRLWKDKHCAGEPFGRLENVSPHACSSFHCADPCEGKRQRERQHMFGYGSSCTKHHDCLSGKSNSARGKLHSYNDQIYRLTDVLSNEDSVVAAKFGL